MILSVVFDPSTDRVYLLMMMFQMKCVSKQKAIKHTKASVTVKMYYKSLVAHLLTLYNVCMKRTVTASLLSVFLLFLIITLLTSLFSLKTHFMQISSVETRSLLKKKKKKTITIHKENL